MKCQVKINGQNPPFMAAEVVVNQTCRGLSSASITLIPDVNDPLTTAEINTLLGASVDIAWQENGGGGFNQTFTGMVDRLLPSLSKGIQRLELSIITTGEGMLTSPWLRVFTEKNLSEITGIIGSASNRNIEYTGEDPLVKFSIQQYEDDISYLSRLAEKYGKVFYHDGAGFYLKDWAGNEQATSISMVQISDVNADLNLTPARLELRGRLNNASEVDSFNTFISTPSTSPLSTVYEKSEIVYDQAQMSLPQLLWAEEAATSYPALMRRQVRQMVVVSANTTNENLVCSEAITFDQVPILEGDQRYRIAELTHYFGARGAYSNTLVAIPDEQLAIPANLLARQPGNSIALRAVVSQLADEEQLGRATVVFPEADYADESPYLSILSPYTGNGGSFFHPEVDDEVLLFAPNGLLEKSPVILGAFYSANNNADNWQRNNSTRRGFQSGAVGIFAEQGNGRLTITADEVVFKVNGNMAIDVEGKLTQKAQLIQLNP